MANEFTKPVKIQPAVAGNIADPDEYNQNIAGQSKDSLIGVDIDGNYEDFDLGDETRDSVTKDIKMREADGAKVRIYNGAGALQKTTNLSQATESEAGVAEIATQAEVDAGVDDTNFVTPAKLANATSLNPDLNNNLVGRKFFNGSGTWSKPSGVNTIIVEVVSGGGGGGGGSFGGGGGAGGYSFKRITSGIGATETVTVGTGGAGGAGNNVAGANGGNSSFGGHATVTGGVGGGGASGGSSGSGGAGGSGSDGSSNISGGGGSAGNTATDGEASGGSFNGVGSISGNGGISNASQSGAGGGISSVIISALVGMDGSGADGVSGQNGNDGAIYGGGGSGSATGGGIGGDGANGAVVVWEYII